MNLIDELEKGNTRANRDRLARWVGSDAKRFRQMMAIYLKGDFRAAQLAAGVVTLSAEAHPHLVQPWLAKIVDRMAHKGIHNAVQRTAVHILQSVDIPSRLSGKVANLCFEYIKDISQPIAVRVFSMTVLANIAKKEPDLARELTIVVKELFPYGTGAFRSRARHVLRSLGAHDVPPTNDVVSDDDLAAWLGVSERSRSRKGRR